MELPDTSLVTVKTEIHYNYHCDQSTYEAAIYIYITVNEHGYIPDSLRANGCEIMGDVLSATWGLKVGSARYKVTRLYNPNLDELRSVAIEYLKDQRETLTAAAYRNRQAIARLTSSPIIEDWTI